MGWKRAGIAAAVVIVGLIVLGRLAAILVDGLWFSSVGYVGVFWTILVAKAAVFLTVSRRLDCGALALGRLGAPLRAPPRALG